MWPCGVNAFLDACPVWHDLMVSGEIGASARFRVWAETPARAYDPAATSRPGDFDGG